MTDESGLSAEAEEQIGHYKRIASLRKRSLEAAILRIYELEAVIRKLGGTPPPWDPIATEENSPPIRDG